MIWQEKRYAAAERHFGDTIPISRPTRERDRVEVNPEFEEMSASLDELDNLSSISEIYSKLGFGRIPRAQQAES